MTMDVKNNLKSGFRSSEETAKAYSGAMSDKQFFHTNSVVVGDTIRFTEGVFCGSYRRPKFIGERTITATILRDSYGDEKQQHTFTIKVIDSGGTDALARGKTTRRKGRNVYRNGVTRLEWADENARQAIESEKHGRGAHARKAREIRKGMDFQDYTQEGA